MQHSLCARTLQMYFMYNRSLGSQKDPLRWVLLSLPFCRLEGWGSERCGDLPDATRLEGGRLSAWIWRASLAPHGRLADLTAGVSPWQKWEVEKHLNEDSLWETGRGYIKREENEHDPPEPAWIMLRAQCLQSDKADFDPRRHLPLTNSIN